MRTLLLIVVLGLSFGCGSAGTPMAAMSAIQGKLETSGGKPVGGVLLTLHPLEGQHPAYLQVAEDGSFKGDAVTGKYTYFLGKSTAKNSEQNLKQVNAKYYEADLARTIVIRAGEEMRISLQ